MPFPSEVSDLIHANIRTWHWLADMNMKEPGFIAKSYVKVDFHFLIFFKLWSR